jgi:hypothetical protein
LRSRRRRRLVTASTITSIIIVVVVVVFHVPGTLVRIGAPGLSFALTLATPGIVTVRIAPPLVIHIPVGGVAVVDIVLVGVVRQWSLLRSMLLN